MVVYSPVGPNVSFSRIYRSKLAEQGYFSPGLSPGWVHNYDVSISGASGNWGVLTLRYPNGAAEQLTPVLDSNGAPTGRRGADRRGSVRDALYRLRGIVDGLRIAGSRRIRSLPSLAT